MLIFFRQMRGVSIHSLRSAYKELNSSESQPHEVSTMPSSGPTSFGQQKAQLNTKFIASHGNT